LLTDTHSADVIDQELQQLGYRCLHRNADAGNYARGDERVDFLYSSRPAAVRLLATAGDFKLHALVNNPRRTQDLEDIRALIRANRDTPDIAVVRDYIKLFDREALCSVWPTKPIETNRDPYML
jgi:hypothetical protein